MATNHKDNSKRHLRNLDDLFNVNDSGNQQGTKRSVVSLEIDRLKPFKNHPFRLYEGERLQDMVESVRLNGILVPIIIRKNDASLEILAGHNRVNAAKQAELTEVPAIVLENISDDEALVYVVETNLIQRSFADMAHSEKSAVIALHHSKMFSQGKRNDILEQLKMLENPHEDGEKSTFRQVDEKLRSDKRVAEMYNLSAKSISRYLRINQLIPTLKSRLDNDSLAFIPAVTLSFLKDNEQKSVDECMNQHEFTVDMKKADMLRDFSEKGKLDNGNVLKILSGETTQKSSRTPTIKINKAVYMKYFKPEQSAKEIQEIIEKALKAYFE